MKKVKIFTQNIDIYNEEILVIIGDAKLSDIEKTCNKSLIKEIKTDWKRLEKAFEGKQGLFSMLTSGRLLIFIRENKDDLIFYDTLVHELKHLVFGLSKELGLEEEDEAQAYLMGYLFREIRKKYKL